MSEKSNADLISIITIQKSDYQEEAVRAALEELQSRELSYAEKSQIENNNGHLSSDQSAHSRNELPQFLKIIFIWGIIPIYVVIAFYGFLIIWLILSL